MSSPRSPRAVGAVLLVLVGLVLGGCAGGSPTGRSQLPSASDVVRVGSTGTAEDRLLAEIYATALSIKGTEVERRFGTVDGMRSVQALRDGAVDLVPASTGALLAQLDPSATATGAADVYSQLEPKLAPSIEALQPSVAEDKPALVVTRAFARQNDLRSITDLARLCPTVTLGGSPEFSTRPDGLPGLQRNYGCAVKEFRALDARGPQTVAALRDGSIQAAELTTTDPAIPTDDLVILDDPRSNFVAQQVVPLINGSKLTNPAVADTLNRISTKLDTATLTDLNRRLDGPGGPDPAQVARDWLSSAGIG